MSDTEYAERLSKWAEEEPEWFNFTQSFTNRAAAADFALEKYNQGEIEITQENGGTRTGRSDRQNRSGKWSPEHPGW